MLDCPLFVQHVMNFTNQQLAIIEIFTNPQTSRNFIACFPPNFGKTTALKEVIRRDMKTFGKDFKPIILRSYWHPFKEHEWYEFADIAAIRHVPFELSEEQIKSLEHWIDENTPGKTKYVLYTDNSFDMLRKLDQKVLNKENIISRKHVIRTSVTLGTAYIEKLSTIPETVLVTPQK